MKYAFALALIAVLAAGCASSGRKIDQSAVDRIEKGETTQTEVVGLLGSPDHVTRLGSGDTIFTYAYFRATTRPSTFIPVIGGTLVGGADVENQTVQVTFGEDDVVKDVTTSYGATGAGIGLESGSGADMPDVEEGKRPK